MANINVEQPVAAIVDIDTKKNLSLNKNLEINLDTAVTYGSFPIMGYVYEPTDIEGQMVQVKSSLKDFYYMVDSSNTITQLYWSSQPLSYNTTNDNYNYKLK